MSEERLIVSEEDAFELLVFLASAAEISVFEPEIYGTFRLVDGCSRLLEAMGKHAPAQRRRTYQELKQEIDQKKVWMMWDREGYLQFLRELPARLAAELKERQQSRPEPAAGRAG